MGIQDREINPSMRAGGWTSRPDGRADRTNEPPGSATFVPGRNRRIPATLIPPCRLAVPVAVCGRATGRNGRDTLARVPDESARNGSAREAGRTNRPEAPRSFLGATCRLPVCSYPPASRSPRGGFWARYGTVRRNPGECAGGFPAHSGSFRLNPARPRQSRPEPRHVALWARERFSGTLHQPDSRIVPVAFLARLTRHPAGVRSASPSRVPEDAD